GSPERLEFDPIDPVVEVELCEPSRDGAPRFQLIGPDRHDEQHRGLAEVPGQERGEGEGVLVGPLDVLDHDEDGAVAGETLDDRKDRLEEPARATAVSLSRGDHPPAIRELGKQPRDLVARGSEKPGDATRIHGSSQPPQPLDVGRVRGGSAGGRYARASQDGDVPVARVGLERRYKARLADAGLTADDDRPAEPLTGPFQCVIKPGELPFPPDHRTAVAVTNHLTADDRDGRRPDVMT